MCSEVSDETIVLNRLSLLTLEIMSTHVLTLEYNDLKTVMDNYYIEEIPDVILLIYKISKSVDITKIVMDQDFMLMK